MKWKETMAEWGGADMTFLSEDMETMTFVVVADPVLYEGNYKGNTTRRVLAPVVTTEGFTILVLGMRVARRLAKYEEKFDDVAFELTRHGEARNTQTTYSLVLCTDATLITALQESVVNEFEPAELEEHIASVRKAMGQ